MWTQKDSWADLRKCVNWNKAKSYVDELNTGGHTDWRLPTVKELKTLYEESKTSNMTYDGDPDYPIHLDKIFAGSASYEYWTSEIIAPCCVQVVYFFNGFVYGDSLDECIDEGVRAVRIASIQKKPKNKLLKGTMSEDGRYMDNGDGTITDRKTNLMWTKKDSWGDTGKCIDWNSSKKYVSNLKTGGYSDWRLPTVKELGSIFEASKSNNMAYNHDPEYLIHLDKIFGDMSAYEYWSSEEDDDCCARDFDFFGFSGDGNHAKDFCDGIGARAVR